MVILTHFYDTSFCLSKLSLSISGISQFGIESLQNLYLGKLTDLQSVGTFLFSVLIFSGDLQRHFSSQGWKVFF